MIEYIKRILGIKQIEMGLYRILQSIEEQKGQGTISPKTMEGIKIWSDYYKKEILK